MIPAIEKLRNMVAYFDSKVESINQGAKSIKDLETIYDYETSNNTDEMFGDEMIWHACQVNRILKYKFYWTNQEMKRGKLTY